MTGPENFPCPRPWHELTPDEQRAEWERYHAAMAQWAPPPPPLQPAPPPAPTGNVPASIALASSIVGLFVFTVPLGALAVIAGIVGWAKAKEQGAGRSNAAVGAIVLGSLEVVFTLMALGAVGP